jgi:hypothetical protein
VDWSKFDPSEVELVRKAINCGHSEHLASIIMEVTPPKAEEIGRIQKQLRTNDALFTSKAQKEFEIWCSTHLNELTPAIEREWQAKIDAERADHLKSLAGDVQGAEMKAVDGTSDSRITYSNNIADLKGIGEKSLGKLRAANILTVDEFKKAGHEKRQEVIGPLAASVFKDFN